MKTIKTQTGKFPSMSYRLLQSVDIRLFNNNNTCNDKCIEGTEKNNN